jgi:hypothetical protein
VQVRNVAQYNFGHDAMGYCASIFAAGGEVTHIEECRRFPPREVQDDAVST